jgi:hypothetical protein
LAMIGVKIHRMTRGILVPISIIRFTIHDCLSKCSRKSAGHSALLGGRIAISSSSRLEGGMIVLLSLCGVLFSPR